MAVKERAINHHGFVLVHTSHTRLDPSEDLQSSQEDTWQSEGVGKIWTKTLQYLAHNSLTAFRPTAITSEEFLCVEVVDDRLENRLQAVGGNHLMSSLRRKLKQSYDFALVGGQEP